MKILLAVDGSPTSTRAVRYAVKLVRQLAQPADLVLFYADPPISKAVAIEIGPTAQKRLHDDNGEFAIKAARAALKRARVAFKEERVVAKPAEAIAKYAQSGRFDLIVMGSRGRGAIKGLLLGSVTSKVIAHCDTPVTIVR